MHEEHSLIYVAFHGWLKSLLMSLGCEGFNRHGVARTDRKRAVALQSLPAPVSGDLH